MGYPKIKKLSWLILSKKICAIEKPAHKFAAVGNRRTSKITALIIKTKTLPDLG